MNLTALSDQELLAGLDATVGSERELGARVVAYLVEVEDRRLDLKDSHPSLFEFCTRRLGFSDGEAFRRITAARLVRRFPVILGMLERGEVHMSTLVLLRDYLTSENHEALLHDAARKTKNEVKELIARRFPRADVPASISPLPAPTASPALPERPAAQPTREHVSSPAAIEPLAPERYKLEVTVGAETRAKLERAVDLMRHRNPSGDFATVVDVALDALIEHLEKEKRGKGARPKPEGEPTTSGRVSRATRREVFERDGSQCTYENDTGHRCSARGFLELDHVIPRAKGGDDSARNLRLRCRAHNRLAAEEVFGRQHVEDAIDFSQRKSRLASLARGLRDLGFREPDARKAIATLESRYPRALPALEQLVRAAIGLLT